MKVFRFRAQRLLEWRRAQEEAARVAFMRASESARETAARLADAEERREQASRDYRRAIEGTVNAGILERYRNWIAARQSEVNVCRQSHQQRSIVLETATEALRLAERNRRVLERLRDRAWRRYLDASRRAEMKEFDALATLRFARRMAQGGSPRDR